MKYLLNNISYPGLKILSLILIVFAGCKKYTTVPAPVTELASNNIFNADNTAIAAINHLYSQLENSSVTVNESSALGLSADELAVIPTAGLETFQSYYQNALSANGIDGAGYGDNFGDVWYDYYPLIYDCNMAIQGLTAANTLTPAIKQQLLGEAEFMRAFYYFHLVNLFGDVPLVLTTDAKINNLIARNPANQVYEQIISDLKDAQNKLSQDYLDGSLLNKSTERVRPTKWAAMALLARVYIYYGNNWQSAKDASTQLIDNVSLFSLDALQNVFLKSSLGNNEAIWQLQPTALGYNTPEGKTYVIPPTGPGTNGVASGLYLNPALVNSFEPSDKRMENWVGHVTTAGVTYYFAYKYKIWQYDPAVTTTAAMTEYTMVLRLAEQYLIRAEAEANLNDPGDAINDLNVIRRRAGLTDYTGPADINSLRNAILHERQVELFTEWGQRWMDLKRTGKIDSVMSVVTPQKGGTWASYKSLFPVPLTQIKTDPNLIQNPGY